MVKIVNHQCVVNLTIQINFMEYILSFTGYIDLTEEIGMLHSS